MNIELIEVRLFHRRRGLLQNTLYQDEMFLFISGFLGKKTIFGGELPRKHVMFPTDKTVDRRRSNKPYNKHLELSLDTSNICAIRYSIWNS